MPQRGWSRKRERRYEHIEDGLLARGESEDTARQRNIAGRSRTSTAELERALADRSRS